MDGKNQVSLIGSVGKDAETKLVGENRQMATFSVATNSSYKNKAGEKITDTEWHNVVVWGELSKFVGTYIKKGDIVSVEGSLKNEKYVDKEGKTHYNYKVVANQVMQIVSKSRQNAAATSTSEKSAAEKQTEKYATATDVKTTSEVFSGSAADDDLPF